MGVATKTPRFGSRTASGKLTVVNQISFSNGGVAREIRVYDNPASSADYASLNVSGSVTDSLLKGGDGILELGRARRQDARAKLGVVHVGLITEQVEADVVSREARAIGALSTFMQFSQLIHRHHCNPNHFWGNIAPIPDPQWCGA